METSCCLRRWLSFRQVDRVLEEHLGRLDLVLELVLEEELTLLAPILDRSGQVLVLVDPDLQDS